MVTYPIHIGQHGYRGSDPKKRAKSQAMNQLASKLESHINEQLKTQVEPIRVYSYHEIASETGIEYETVRNLCFSIDSGSGGFTGYKAELTQEQAMPAHRAWA